MMAKKTSGRPTVLLDVPMYGLEGFIRDRGFESVKMPQGRSDDLAIDLARENGYLVVTPDEQLVERCRALDIAVIDVGFRAMRDVALRYLTEHYP